MIPVVVRTRNRHSELASCLNSLVWQTYKHFGVLLFDDGDLPATDDPFVRNAIETLSHIKGVSVQHIRYQPQDHLGMRYWQNACFVMQTVREMGHEWMVMLDDDEFVPPDFIEKLMEVRDYEQPHLGFVYSPVIDASDVLDRPLKVPNHVLRTDIPDSEGVEIRHSRFSDVALKPLRNRPWVSTGFMAGGMTLMLLNDAGIKELCNTPMPHGDDAFYGRWLLKKGMKGFIRLDMFVVHNVAKSQWARPR